MHDFVVHFLFYVKLNIISEISYQSQFKQELISFFVPLRLRGEKTYLTITPFSNATIKAP
jgi:hypothetical protein